MNARSLTECDAGRLERAASKADPAELARLAAQAADLTRRAAYVTGYTAARSNGAGDRTARTAGLFALKEAHRALDRAGAQPAPGGITT